MGYIPVLTLEVFDGFEKCAALSWWMLAAVEIFELTHCGLVTSYGDGISVNISSGNGLLPDSTKPLPEPMLTDQWSPVTFLLGQFHKRCLNHQSLKSSGKLHVNMSKISCKFPRGQWVKWLNYYCKVYWLYQYLYKTDHMHVCIELGSKLGLFNPLGPSDAI